MKVDLKKLFFEFEEQSFGLLGFKMAARLGKRTKTSREVIKLLFNMEKNPKKNRYKQSQKESVYQPSVPLEHSRPSYGHEARWHDKNNLDSGEECS